MQFALAMLDSGEEIQRWPIDMDEVIIGRSDKANVIIDGGTISRQHVRLWLEDGIVAAEDLGSRNGIKINGVRTRSGSLENGDHMEVGKYSFVVTARDAAPVSVKNGEAPVQAPNAEGRALQKRSMQNPDVRVNAALVYAARLQPYLFERDVLLKHMTKIIMNDVPAQRCYVLACSAGESRLKTLIEFARNGSSDGPALNTTIIDYAFQKGKPVIVGDVSEVETLDSEPGEKNGVICVPLISNKVSVGALYVDSGWNTSRFVFANFENMKAYGMAFGAIIEQTMKVEEQIAKARMEAVLQSTSAVGKCLYEQFMEIREAANDSDEDMLERVMARSDQAAQQMIALAYLRHTSRSTLNIVPVIDKALGDLRKDIEKKSVTVNFDADGRALVFGDPHQLHRVMYGLLATCIDSCEEEIGKIIITAENQTDGCHIVIRDNGKGIPPTVAQSLSSNVIDNAGLGMNGVMVAHAYGVVKFHGGTIKTESVEGEGGRFGLCCLSNTRP